MSGLARAVAAIAFVVVMFNVSQAHGKPVGLSQSEVAPTYLTYLWPGASVTYASEDDGYNCVDKHGRGVGWFSDVSAYTWQGKPLSQQQWAQHHTLTFWRAKKGRVTFDGITFRNHTSKPVLVAGWCE